MADANILETICAKRLEAVEHAMQTTPLADMQVRADIMRDQQKGFLKAITTTKGPALITEIKKASPSAGLIRDDFDAGHLARTLEQAGATALSVLTEPDWFQGSLDDLDKAREACSLPILRKDFIVHEWQVYETAAAKADCLLLIVAGLSQTQLDDYHAIAQGLGLDVLVEVHTLEELERAVRIKNLQLLGINNRNLINLAIDTHLSKQLFPLIPENLTCVSESGIKTPETLFSLYHQGYKGFLIGHALMQETDPKQALNALLGA